MMVNDSDILYLWQVQADSVMFIVRVGCMIVGGTAERGGVPFRCQPYWFRCQPIHQPTYQPYHQKKILAFGSACGGGGVIFENNGDFSRIRNIRNGFVTVS